MYNSKQMKVFIDKVNEEASEAAQKVYDKYQKEFEQRILNQIPKGHTIEFSMGHCLISKNDELDHNLTNTEFAILLADSIFYNDLRGGFDNKTIKK